MIVEAETPPASGRPSLGGGAEDTAVRVAVRVRPFVPKERLEQCRPCVRTLCEERQIVIGKDRAFAFDYVFGTESSQLQVFEEACAPLVQRCFQGYNATVFAYGQARTSTHPHLPTQLSLSSAAPPPPTRLAPPPTPPPLPRQQTGSGKTYTMGAGSVAGWAPEQIGVIPRAVEQLFNALESCGPEEEWSLRVSFLEIHNEEVKDLLHPRTPTKAITIREDGAGDIFVLGVREDSVHSREQMLQCLEAGSACRTTGSTLMNEQSSRSHSRAGRATGPSYWCHSSAPWPLGADTPGSWLPHALGTPPLVAAPARPGRGRPG